MTKSLLRFGPALLGAILLLVIDSIGVRTGAKAAVVPVDLATLTAAAEVIVLGKVESGTAIEDGVVVRPQRSFKGQAPDPLNLVATGLGLYEARFAPGERMILFLVASGANFKVVFGARGKFTIKDGLVLETGGKEDDLITRIEALVP
jgi:hypothetical protein